MALTRVVGTRRRKAKAGNREATRSPVKGPPGGGVVPFDEPDIAALTSDILQHHGAANRQSVETRAEVGRLLLEVKQRLKHGAFHAYLRQKVPFNRKTADRAINLQRFKIKRPALFDKIAPLGISKAYMLIALPPERITELASQAHTIASTGATKTLLAMTFTEFMTLIVGPPQPAQNTPAQRVRTFKRATDALIRAANVLTEQPSLIEPATVDDTIARLQRLLHMLTKTFPT